MDEIFIKIYNETSTDLERAEFRHLKVRLEEIMGKIELYMKNVNLIKKAVG